MASPLLTAAGGGVGTGVSVTGNSVVFVKGDSVFDGAKVQIEAATTDTEADYSPIHVVDRIGGWAVSIPGDHFIRCSVIRPGGDTSINAEVSN